MKNLKWIIGFLTILLGLNACIQGPWSYAPKDNSEYQGIYTEGTLVADRSIKNICFEKLLDLDEYYTPHFAFYQDAKVSVTGSPVGGSSTELVLAPQVGKPNCFEGDSNFILKRGESYRLKAEFTWDSAGTMVETIYEATANIPTKMILSDTATVNEKAFTPPDAATDITSPEGIFALINGLPQEGQDVFLEEYNGVIQEFIGYLSAGDTVAAQGVFQQNAFGMNERISQLYQTYEVRAPYVQGDTIYYLTGALNTTSHYYHFDYSDDIGSILVTHRFSDSAVIPNNGFSEAFSQFGLTAADFYPSSTVRRLIHLPNYYDTKKNISLFDSLTVNNSWYIGGENTFYFYGYEQAMTDYILTYIEEHTNPKVRKEFNIENGRGVFAGAILDSFEVYVKNPESNPSWTLFETHAAHCAEQGWQSTLDCQDFELEYCREVKFDGLKYAQNKRKEFSEIKAYNKCERTAYQAAWLDGVDESTYLNLIPEIDLKTSDELTEIRNDALVSYCAKTFFQDSKCAELEQIAHSWSVDAEKAEDFDGKKLKDFHWQRCRQDAWSGVTCDWALRSFCVEEKINSNMMCAPAQEWCETQSSEIFCGKEPS